MNEVVEMEQTAQPAGQVALGGSQGNSVPAVTTPSELLRLAVVQGADMDKLERLMALQERWEANEARKAYVDAMAEFKKNPPEIFKRKLVEHSGISYKHATIGDVCSITIEALANVGISHRWKTIQAGDGMIAVECVLTHRLGHSESNRLEAPPDNSGKKNAIQSISSTVTYLERYTLLAACGLATKDEEDDDGQGSEAEKERVKSPINGARFSGAIAAVKNGTYSADNVRKNFALTVDQETVLADAEKGVA